MTLEKTHKFGRTFSKSLALILILTLSPSSVTFPESPKEAYVKQQQEYKKKVKEGLIKEPPEWFQAVIFLVQPVVIMGMVCIGFGSLFMDMLSGNPYVR